MTRIAKTQTPSTLLMVLIAAFALIGVGFLVYSQAAEGDWVNYSDSHPEIQYSALKSGCDDFSSEGWALCSDQGGFFDSSYHYTNNIGQSFSFTFNGTGLRIYSDVSDHAGIMAVEIDGEAAGEIDYYSGPYEQQVMVFEKTGLPAGNHTFKATLTGKNTQSTGTFVGVDQVSIQGVLGEGAEPSPSPSPSPTLNPSPSPSPSPTTDPSPSPTLDPSPSPSPSPEPTISSYDANIDGIPLVGVGDLSILIANYGKTNAVRTDGDLDANGTINVLDLSRLIKHWGLEN